MRGPHRSRWPPRNVSVNPPAWLPRALSAAISVVLVAGVAAAVVKDDDTNGSRPEAARSTNTTAAEPENTTTTSTTEAPAAEEVDPELAATVERLSAFVAAERGLDFREPVPVQLLEDDEFDARLLEGAEEDREEFEQSARVLRALELIPPGVDLFETVTSFLGESVLGFYDTEANELFLRGAELTPYVETTLVHELTHALDDQHFELFRPDLAEADDERFTGFQALYEGSAVRVEEAFVASLDPDERREAAEEEAEFGAGIDLSGVPEIVPDLLSFPYLAGPPFLQALLDDGDEERVNEAFRAPPLTTEHILHPESFLDGEAIVDVPPPAADADEIERGVYGEWALLLTLARAVAVDEARAASEGWGGDAYVAWADGDRTCVRTTFAADSAADLAEMVSAWQAWADAHADADVSPGPGMVTVTACG